MKLQVYWTEHHNMSPDDGWGRCRFYDADEVDTLIAQLEDALQISNDIVKSKEQRIEAINWRRRTS